MTHSDESGRVGTRPYDDCCGDCGERGMYCCDGGWNTRAGAEVERLREERQAVLDVVNIYGDETLHSALDDIGWPS